MHHRVGDRLAWARLQEALLIEEALERREACPSTRGRRPLAQDEEEEGMDPKAYDNARRVGYWVGVSGAVVAGPTRPWVRRGLAIRRGFRLVRLVVTVAAIAVWTGLGVVGLVAVIRWAGWA